MKETYSTGEGPICPYCGHENSSAGNDYWAEKAVNGEHDCDNCGKPFAFSVDYTTHYYAKAFRKEPPLERRDHLAAGRGHLPRN